MTPYSTDLQPKVDALKAIGHQLSDARIDLMLLELREDFVQVDEDTLSTEYETLKDQYMTAYRNILGIPAA